MKLNKIENPKPTWFFERPNGTVIAVQEQEAWSLYRNRNQVAGVITQPLKMLGMSDGRAYYKAVVEAHEIFKTDLEKAQERLRAGFDEELAVARGNLVKPRNFDTIGRDGRATSIQELQR